MVFLFEPRPFSKKNKDEAVEAVIAAAIPDRDFYILVIGASLFALFGIALDSIPVLIGSMIVAPLAAPILALGLGIALGDMRLMARSCSVLITAGVCACAVTAFVAHFLPPFNVNGTFISFIAHPLYDLSIAVIAGCIAAYGYVRTKTGSALTGIGIAISLMPPLVASALALSSFNTSLLSESSTIFLLNVTGILLGSSLIFSIFNLKK